MNENRLTILWTNADPKTAELMVFMYAQTALRLGWWESVKIIVWGSTAQLVAENEHIRNELIKVKESGVEVGFCIACATKLGVVDQIEALGFELIPMGEPLTKILKNGEKLLTV